MKHHITGLFIVLASFLFLPATAFAVLLDGKTVEYQYLFPAITSNYGSADNGNKLVGPGVEVSNVADGQATMNISDTNLFIDYTGSSSWTPATFNGFRITDIFGTISAFGGVTINPATNLVGFNSSRITFDADHIWVNWQDLAFDSNTVVSLDLRAVPEPSSLVLAAMCIFGLAWRRRRV